MRITKLLKLADIFTIANLCCGVLAIFFALQLSFGVVAVLLLAAVFFDVLDGRIAGIMRQKNAFGKQLDSLADMVSFGVAPAVFYFAMGSRSLLVILVLLFFVVCGMLRLARFNISRQKDFSGVPITVNGIIFPALFLISTAFPTTLAYWPVAFLVMGFLMISSIRVKKVF